MKKRNVMQNIVLLIVETKTGSILSTPKPNTPKMANALAEIAKKYSKQFESEFKVKRALVTAKGYKFL